MEQPRPASQKPLGLAGMLNSAEDNRDSAYFSSTDASSKHTSAASGFGPGGLSPMHSGFHTSPTDKTPSPTANGMMPQPMISPAGSMSVASMVSPTTPGSADPRRIYDRPQSLESAPNSATFGPHADHLEAMSRRESVDSRFNQGFTDMRLGNSPYASHNQSSTSIHNTLHQQRNPRPGFENLSVHRISNGYQPNAERNPDGQGKTLRVAPAITGPATSQIARAAEPTKGQAWAFPEEDIQRMPSVASQSLVDSRRSSIAESLASSQYTTESRLPPGQRRLDEGPLAADYQRMSTASGDFPAVHHHTLQHKQIGDLQAEELNGPGGSQPYSRTPELRVSHKLAERKRRTEMKELFEQLRDLMPQERGSKASKWEILTKAISEHNRATDHIKSLQNYVANQNNELEILRRENAALRMDQERMRGAAGPPAPGNDAYATDQFGRPRPELPPLRSLNGAGSVPTSAASGPDSMTGVQYDQARPAGFRPVEATRF